MCSSDLERRDSKKTFKYPVRINSFFLRVDSSNVLFNRLTDRKIWSSHPLEGVKGGIHETLKYPVLMLTPHSGVKGGIVRE